MTKPPENAPAQTPTPTSEKVPFRNKYIDLLATKPDRIGKIPSRTDLGMVPEQIAAAIARYNGKVVVELGSGSGEHLIAQALRAPDTLHIGFELRFKRVFRTAEKSEEALADNMIVLQGDATVLPQMFKPGSLAGIYVNFPDPWAKPRQRKHRLLNTNFLDTILTHLTPGGFFSFKTDHREYFLSTVELLRTKENCVTSFYSEDLAADITSEYSKNNIPTEFERMFRSQGLPIHQVVVHRK
jgi:tRNA (guanine-N7-)-methyltransferase